MGAAAVQTGRNTTQVTQAVVDRTRDRRPEPGPGSRRWSELLRAIALHPVVLPLLERRFRRKLREAPILFLLFLCALLSVVTTVGIVIILLTEAVPSSGMSPYWSSSPERNGPLCFRSSNTECCPCSRQRSSSPGWPWLWRFPWVADGHLSRRVCGGPGPSVVKPTLEVLRGFRRWCTGSSPYPLSLLTSSNPCSTRVHLQRPERGRRDGNHAHPHGRVPE